MTSLDPDLLSPVFGEHLGPDVRIVSVTRGPVGNGQEIWYVETSDPDRELVVRRTASSGPLAWTDRAAEYRVLEALARTDLPVPVVHWAGDADAGLDRDYFVMDRMPGEPVLREDPETLAAIASDLGHNLARLHATRLHGITEPVSSAADATRTQIAMWRERYLADRLAPVPLIGLLLAWLERHIPSSASEPALLWGDPGPHNILHIDGKITALLDWELSHVGDPLEDLGAAVWSCSGSCDPERLIAGYERENGSAVDGEALTYFEVFACVTRSLMLLGAVGAYAAGATAAPNLAGLGLHLVQANLERALQLLGKDSFEIPEVIAPDPDPDRVRPDITELLGGVAAFLREDVRPHVTDSRLGRGLKTVDALLATVALRLDAEGPIGEIRRRIRDRLLAELDAAGVDVSQGVEAAVVVVQTDDRYRTLRGTVWRALAQDLAATRALALPLAELYGST